MTFAFVLFVTGCQPPSSAPKTEPSTPVKPSARLELMEWKGQGRLSLDDVKSKNALLYVFAPWTDHGKSTPEWLRQASELGLTVIPVIIDQAEATTTDQSWESVRPYVASPEFLKAVGGVRALPTAIQLDASGKVTQRWAGAFPPSVIATSRPPSPATM